MSEPVMTILDSGIREWRVNNKLHRLDGPARITPNGRREWWVEDKLHRLDGPARIWADGTEEWWVNDECHRLDGPAIIDTDGSDYWCAHNKFITYRVEKMMEQGLLGRDWTQWTEEDRIMMRLCFSDA